MHHSKASQPAVTAFVLSIARREGVQFSPRVRMLSYETYSTHGIQHFIAGRAGDEPMMNP